MAKDCCRSKEIGGYFELSPIGPQVPFPVDGERFNTARNSLEYIIKRTPEIEKIYLPFFTCDAILEPIDRLGIKHEFYHINNSLEIAAEIRLSRGEFLIANNYFGLKDRYIDSLSLIYGNKLIVDNAQALFAVPQQGTKAFYSPRKFVGVADGGFAIGVDSDGIKYQKDNSIEHDSHLFIRLNYGAEAGFMDYQKNEKKLSNNQILSMSLQTEEILSHIDYNDVVKTRRDNYSYISTRLDPFNLLRLPDSWTFNCPMVYPFLYNDQSLRRKLIDNKVFVAKYWPNIYAWTNQDDYERILSDYLIPIPIDQRYGICDMERIIKIIQENILP